ncbi:MAG: hypothetical protein QM535_06105 [Limnohabitans sp.]|nr:hypothetical protein [Limnohabitans sp.]
MKIKVLILLVLLCSCNKNKEKKKIIKEIAVKDTLKVDKRCLQRDTVTPMGTKIGYLYQDGKFKITWGDTNYKRVYDSIYSCDYDKNTGIWDFVPKYESETKNTIVLTNILFTSSGGNPAPLEFSAVVLPKNKKDSPYEIDFFITKKGDYLVYGDMEESKIHLLNLETKKKQKIKLNPYPAIFRSPTSSILETSIYKNTLFIKYESDDENSESEIIVKKIKIVI